MGAYCLVQGRVWRFYQRNKDRLDSLSTSIKLMRVKVTHKKDRLEPLSSMVNLTTEVGNHTQTGSTHFQLITNCYSLKETGR